MAEPAQFSARVRDAFAHLEDRPHLAGHPLGELLLGPEQAGAPDLLHRLILDAIGELRPPDGRAGTVAWRRWQAMHLRYVDRLSTKQVARRLQMSERQALRDLKAGVEAVAGILRKRLDRGEAAGQHGPSPAALTNLEQEMQRVAAEEPGASADLGAIVAQVLETVRGLALAHAATVELTLPDELAPVAAHPAVLRQLVLCLLSAAVEGDPSPRVEVAAVARVGAVELDVAARGRAGPTAAAGPDRPDADALVATVERLAGLLGGSVRVERADDIRHFAVTLPAASQPILLVVDDNPDMGELFRWYLADQQVRVVQARSAASAIELARALRPDAITMDVMMPSQDGWQLLQRLRADPATADIPTVVCSVLPERSLALSLGVAGFLAKPVTQHDLVTALGHLLSPGRRAGHPGSPGDSASSPPR